MARGIKFMQDGRHLHSIQMKSYYTGEWNLFLTVGACGGINLEQDMEKCQQPLIISVYCTLYSFKIRAKEHVEYEHSILTVCNFQLSLEEHLWFANRSNFLKFSCFSKTLVKLDKMTIKMRLIITVWKCKVYFRNC